MLVMVVNLWTASVCSCCIDVFYSHKSVYQLENVPSYAQEFLKVFDQLRDELVHDDLLGDGQPQQTKEWMKRVRGGVPSVPSRIMCSQKSSVSADD